MTTLDQNELLDLAMKYSRETFHDFGDVPAAPIAWDRFCPNTGMAFSCSMKSKRPTVSFGISFLQMLDAARITLADHRAYDLSGFYIVCTSNIGSQQFLSPTRLPFATLERAVLSELHRVFRPLSPGVPREIGRLAIEEELECLREKGFKLDFLVRRGIHKTLSARLMRKTTQKFIGDAIREIIKLTSHPSGLLKVSPNQRPNGRHTHL
ncbi:hypothetical protein BH09VER1_BH09VER1_54810 [soil metagenome]